MRTDMRDRESARRYRKWRVLLDGIDVSRRCFLADDHPPGLVGLYLCDESGHFYKDGADAAQEFRHGKVTFIPPETA